MADRNNREFRDEAAVSQYPFDPQASGAVFPTGLFLDASLYVPADFTPPFYIQRVEPAADDKVRIIVADSRGIVAGKALCDPAEVNGTAVLYTTYGRSAGVLVFDPTHMAALRGELQAGPQSFSATQTRLASEVVRFYGPKGVLNVLITGSGGDNGGVDGDVSVNNDIRLVFSGGLNYDPVTKSLNLYGEDSSLETALLSLNGQAGEHAFLMAHVYQDYDNESALRIETQGSFIRIGKSRDFV